MHFIESFHFFFKMPPPPPPPPRNIPLPPGRTPAPPRPQPAASPAPIIKEEPINIQRTSSELWTTKFAPSLPEDICGNKASIERINFWLETFTPGEGGVDKAKPKQHFNGVLLHGPPGIGKSTSAHILAKYHGYIPVEFNASDSRAKSDVETKIIPLMTNRVSFLTSESKPKLLIMDEIDGLSGNSDRGGAATFLKALRKSQIPVICVCNDASAASVKTLSSDLMKLEFAAPSTHEIYEKIAALLSVEKVTIDRAAIDAVLTQCHGDIRQVINRLQMIAMTSSNISKSTVDQEGAKNFKDVEPTPFDAAQQLFTSSDIKQKMNLFFVDKDFVPQLIQENYIFRPQLISNKAYAAELISYGEFISNSIYKKQNYSLLPAQAVFSSILPTAVLAGRSSMPMKWPRVLGKISSRNKKLREAQEIGDKLGVHCSRFTRSFIANEILPFLPTLLEAEINEDVDAAAGFCEKIGLDADAYVELLDAAGFDLTASRGDKTKFTKRMKAVSETFKKVKHK